MRKTEKGNNSVIYQQNLTKSKSGHLHLRQSLWSKYHDPSSSGSCDIVFTSFHWVMMRNKEKGANLVMALKNFTKI